MEPMESDPTPALGEKCGVLDGLATDWEATKAIRKRALKDGRLLEWPSQETVGVVNFPALKKNRMVLEALLNSWCPEAPDRKTVPIQHLKPQAGSKVMVTEVYWFKLVFLDFWVILYFYHPCQIREFRRALELKENSALVHCEAHAMKGMVSLLIRRHDGSKRRVARL